MGPVHWRVLAPSGIEPGSRRLCAPAGPRGNGRVRSGGRGGGSGAWDPLPPLHTVSLCHPVPFARPPLVAQASHSRARSPTTTARRRSWRWPFPPSNTPAAAWSRWCVQCTASASERGMGRGGAVCDRTGRWRRSDGSRRVTDRGCPATNRRRLATRRWVGGGGPRVLEEKKQRVGPWRTSPPPPFLRRLPVTALVGRPENCFAGGGDGMGARRRRGGGSRNGLPCRALCFVQGRMSPPKAPEHQFWPRKFFFHKNIFPHICVVKMISATWGSF